MEANKNFAKWLSCGIQISGTFGLHHVYYPYLNDAGGRERSSCVWGQAEYTLTPFLPIIVYVNNSVFLSVEPPLVYQAIVICFFVFFLLFTL
jgi:hypothetical protein